jgi:uncharacterized cupredoxin-like copper-binding protein
MKPSMLPTAVLTLVLLGGCAAQHAGRGDPLPAVSDSQRQAALATVDWEKAEKITIELRDYGFHPRDIRLRVGQAYHLRIFNTGGNTHYLNAPDFFATVAANKVEVPNMAEIRAPQFSQFEIFRRGGELEFEFIPLVAGRFRAHCHLEGHSERGVEGFLIVE